MRAEPKTSSTHKVCDDEEAEFDKYESGFENGANVGFRNWHPVPYVFSRSNIL